MSTTTFRDIARTIATPYDISNGKRLIPDSKRPGQFKVLHKKLNVVMSLRHDRDIRRMNKEVRREAWDLLRWATQNAPELALQVNKAAVFFSRRDCSKLTATRAPELAKEYRQCLSTLQEAERRRHQLTEALEELDALMDRPIA